MTDIRKALEPCPFCGNATAPKIKEFDGEPYVPGYVVICDAAGIDGRPGQGCGCSSGWAETQEEAPIKWNARAALAAPASGGWDSAAVRDVLAERRRQVEAEGWTAKCDNGYTDGELVSAATCYAEHSINPDEEAQPSRPPFGWPWDAGWWKPTTPRRDLVKAVALLIAEIERLDRASAPQVKL